MLSHTEFVILKKLPQLDLSREKNIVYNDNSRPIAIDLIIKFLISSTHAKSHAVKDSLSNLYNAGYIYTSLEPTSKGLALLDSYIKEKMKYDVLSYLPLVISLINLVINIVWRTS